MFFALMLLVSFLGGFDYINFFYGGGIRGKTNFFLVPDLQKGSIPTQLTFNFSWTNGKLP